MQSYIVILEIIVMCNTSLSRERFVIVITLMIMSHFIIISVFTVYGTHLRFMEMKRNEQINYRKSKPVVEH